MHRPRVAVAGSCVSRDVFNTSFIPEYGSHVDLVANVYQSALPSLVREERVNQEIPESVMSNYEDVIRREYSGRNISELVNARPDLLIVDLYADIQFGVTKVDEKYVTRNHMAFTALQDADIYFSDIENKFPLKGRFEGYTSPTNTYYHLAKHSIIRFIERLHAGSPKTKIILNSPRFATSYITSTGEEKTYQDVDRLIKKNKYWSDLDEMFRKIIDCENIDYSENMLLGQELHQWGLNPVHYTNDYYKYFWRELSAIIGE
ncbi:hypothetical protein A3F64_01615 [Candidatus Saccharibacteria bacterium RIFCSPHIGHO2_12_FULL_42_8]|nr:MAG: hypothetical protein A3F64_01615 [Candidatus Saccharibacteria bacterium RIFCSPHIGHO2_12_FULL_42_8]